MWIQQFRIAFIDTWDNEYFYLYIDGNLVFSHQHFFYLGDLVDICGLTNDDYFPNFEVKIDHSNPIIRFDFTTNLNELPTTESFGLRDFQIFSRILENCGNGVLEQNEQCDDGNIYAFDGCFNCQYSCVEGCSNCIDGICFECLNGWILDNTQYICIPICGDLIINGDEQCDINQYIKQSFGCNQCEFNCQHQCINCQFGKCYDCIQGWKLINYQCESICGNNSIQGLEECDDMNSIRFDGCNNCRNDCQKECSYCQRGICLDCIYGWYLTDQFICESQCGDNLIALISNEECEDSNYDQFDGCYQCKIECCHYCNICIYGYCYNCEYTFTLIDQYCIPICGDGLITIGYEQCDDMNQIPYDGCYNCNYQCRQYCKLCIKGICYDQCEYGYYEFDYQCYPICGDGIIVHQEDCDDLNDNQLDGCHNCQFLCPNHCEICQEAKCKLCEQGYSQLNVKFIQNYKQSTVTITNSLNSIYYLPTLFRESR
ncbi:unnamed protein product [Paramecium pentaurelia]|uniref:Uncharacterized protein n=1 Tax=Paramecium pentaurelia TaxID=43138 RepID=A0A8S1WGC2_9CILI|nr:unnamed protein product [Paramecium pentaurelia]